MITSRLSRGITHAVPGLALILSNILVPILPARAQASGSLPDRLIQGFDAIRAADLKHDLSYIASDTMEGRLSLQTADTNAAVWIADQFAKAGLQPAATDASGHPSFLQNVPLIEYQPDAKAMRVSLSRGGHIVHWTQPSVTGFYKQSVNLSALVVFAGFGITAPELGYDDYEGLDVRGKIALIFAHEPQEENPNSVFNGKANTRHATTRMKALAAQRHGAVALLIAPEPNRRHLTNAERFKHTMAGAPSRDIPLPKQAIEHDEISIPVLQIDDGVAAQLMTAGGMTPAVAQSAIDDSARPHSMPLPDTTLSIRLRNTAERRAIAYNVAALLPGSDPKLAAETIIISAHYDHDGMEKCADPSHPPATNPPDPKPCPKIWRGADDNGSGTVGVVALARAFAANPVKPKRSILFVAFAAEERGLLGSYWMAAHPLRPLATTRAMINFDMIGRDEVPSLQTDGVIDIPADTTNRLNLIGAQYSPDYDRMVKEANKAVGLALDYRFDHDSALNIFFRSDQFPFVLHDIPAFWWFTGFHPDYHHTTDTVDKINFRKMTKILRLGYLTAWRFADSMTPPRFIANPHTTHPDK